ncbi:MAG: hypothetical protein RIR00_1273 [Pseudomonadota bacterium]
MSCRPVLALALGLPLCLGGCAGGIGPLLPESTVKLTANTALSLDSVITGALGGAAIWLVYDPLAPNWRIEEQRTSEHTYQFALQMKRFHNGGDGEAMRVIQRRASQLQREQGYAGYKLLDYREGIDSETLGPRRFAEGSVQFIPKPGAVKLSLR